MKKDLILPKESWPVSEPEEAARLKRYRQNNYLFRGQYEKIWDDWHERVTTRWHEGLKIAFVIANFAKIISLLSADLLIGEQGEGFGASCQNPKASEGLQALLERNRFNLTAYEVSGLATSFRGDGVFKVSLKDFQVKIFPQVAYNWFPWVEDGNPKNILRHVLAWPVEIGRNKYLRKEIHEAGRIYNHAYKLNGMAIGEQVKLSALNINDLPEEQETKIDAPLVIHNPNWGIDDSPYGVDDYEDIDGLFYEICVMISRNSWVLARHTDPSMTGDVSCLTRDEKTGQYIVPGGGTFWPVDPGGVKPEYLTWDGKLEAAEKQIDRLLDLLFYVSETSPAAFGLDKNNIPESGAAMKKRLIRTMAKINRKKLYADPAIKDVLETAMKLDVAWNPSAKYEPERPNISWQDGLPDDPTETVENINKRIEGGTISRKRAIMNLDHVGDEEAAKRVEEIQQEQDAALPTYTRTIGEQPINPFRSGQGAGEA